MTVAVPARAVAAMLAAALASACSGPASEPREAAPEPEGPPSILLISLDTTRADHLGCYGDAAAATPTIDAWARRGVVFERAATPIPVTLPAHSTLLTGWLPHRHGVRNNGVYHLPADVPTLAEALRGAGYSTAAVLGSQVLDRQYGLDRGFQIYDDAAGSGQGQLSIPERRADHVTDAALAAAARLRPPYFLFVHYFDAHAAYAPPSPWVERFADRLYDGEIAFVDAQLARLRDGLAQAGKLGPDTVVVITADHGESLGEHGEATHGVFLYQATVRVPLIVVAPGRWPAGARSGALASLADVAPTLASFAGAALAPGADGHALEPQGASAARLALESDFGLDSYGWAPLRGMTDGHLKWIQAPRPELYDLDADPGERENRIDARRDDAARMERAWREAVTADRRALAGAPTTAAEAGERQERLAALGYVAGGAASGADRDGSLPDPKDAISSLELVNGARSLMAQRRLPEAEAKLLEARRAGPRNLSALTLLGICRLMKGDPAAAIEPLEEAARVGPSNADVHFNLGLARLGAGQVEPALASWRRTLALAPRYHDAAVNLVDILSKTGRVEEAVRALAEARRAGVDSPTLQFLDARLAAEQGDVPRARATLEKALSGTLPAPVAAEARDLLQRLGRQE